MTQDDVRLDVSSLVSYLGFTPAVDDFDFEKQPSQQIDRVFLVKLNRIGTVGEIGLGQIEEHRLECWIARQNGGASARDAARSLTVDLDLIESTIQGFAITGHRFNVLDDSVETETEPGADCVIGMLAMDVDFDRDLSVA